MKTNLLFLLLLLLCSCSWFKRGSKVTIKETIPAVKIDTLLGTPVDTNCIDSIITGILKPQTTQDSVKTNQVIQSINRKVKGAVKLPERLILKEGNITTIISTDSTGRARIRVEKPEENRITEIQAQVKETNNWRTVGLVLGFVLLMLFLAFAFRRR